MDQDNALVFAEGAADGPEDRWFAALGAHVADILHEVGVPYCKGGVMAKNPAWRGSLATWRAARRQLDRPLAAPGPAVGRHLLRPARRARRHAARRQLWREAFDAAKGQTAFAKLLVEAAGSNEPGFGYFGGLKHEQRPHRLEEGRPVRIVSAARALAICHHVVGALDARPPRRHQGAGPRRRARSRRHGRCTSVIPGSDPGPAARRHAARPSTHQCGCREEFLPSATRSDCARRSGRSNISMHWFAICCSTADRGPAPNLAMRWREFGASSERASFRTVTCQIYPTCRRNPRWRTCPPRAHRRGALIGEDDTMRGRLRELRGKKGVPLQFWFP